MSNDYFDSADYTNLVARTAARAAAINAFLAAIEAGFDLLPDAAVLKDNRMTAATDSGAANAYVLTSNNHTKTAYTNLMEIWFQATNANTGASTANLDTIGAATIKRQDGTDLQSGDIPDDAIVGLRYDVANGVLKLITPTGDAAAAAASALASATSATSAGTSAGTATTQASAASVSAAAAAASAAAINLPNLSGGAGKMLRVTSGSSGYELRTTAEILSDIGAQASDATLTALSAVDPAADIIFYGTSSSAVATTSLTSFARTLIASTSSTGAQTNLGLVPGVDVQPYDADTAKLDTTQSWTAPQAAQSGTSTDGTLDLSAAQNFYYTPGGNDTLEFSGEDTADQSGLIRLVNSTGVTISLGSEIEAPNGMATILSSSGVYLLSYLVNSTGGGADSVSMSFAEMT